MMMRTVIQASMISKVFIKIIWLGIGVPIIAIIKPLMRRMFHPQLEVEFQAYMVLMEKESIEQAPSK